MNGPDAVEPVFGARDREILARLTEGAVSCIEPAARGAMLDVPHHSNCGDAAILQGIARAFEDRGVRMAYVSNVVTHHDALLRRTLSPGDTVYLHGGGSFGDLYPETHQFRLHAFRELREFRLVLLPQSIWFSSGRIDDATRRAIDAHPNCELHFRDRPSFELAREALKAPCTLSPDMAFALGTAARPRHPDTPVLWLRRTDKEQTRTEPERAADGVMVADWPGTSAGRGTPAGLALHRTMRAAGWSPRLSLHVSRRLVAHSGRLVARGMRILSRGEVVVTDRLHGHILCTILGIPHVAIDPGFGKISGYIDTWTGPLSLVHQREHSHDAIELARELVGPRRSAPRT